ncbi:hypothetical protein OPIT5_00330 (plasmid) [Opitutaceae bacterium TAV5]|nr:hypothetical protein OPIT5_00330 [Opitutaceae bacterium TAV5]
MAQWAMLEPALTENLRSSIFEEGVRDLLGKDGAEKLGVVSEHYHDWVSEYLDGLRFVQADVVGKLANSISQALNLPGGTGPLEGFNRDIHSDRVFASVGEIGRSVDETLGGAGFGPETIRVAEAVVSAGELHLYGVLPAGSSLVPGLGATSGTLFGNMASLMENSGAAAIEVVGESMEQERAMFARLGSSKATLDLVPVFAQVRGPMNVGELADKAGVAWNSAATFIARVETLGLIRPVQGDPGAGRQFVSVPADAAMRARFCPRELRRAPARVFAMLSGRKSGTNVPLPDAWVGRSKVR